MTKAFHNYDILTQEFVSYLTRRNTEDSLREQSSQMSALHQLNQTVASAYQDMDLKLRDLDGKPSIHIIDSKATESQTRQDASVEQNTRTPKRTVSTRSKSRKTRSSMSVTNSEICRQKVKAEAAKAGLDFERRELELRKASARALEEDLKMKAVVERRKVEMEAELKLLEKQKEAAVAEADIKPILLIPTVKMTVYVVLYSEMNQTLVQKHV